MKRLFLIIFAVLLALPLAAQKETFQVVETGWRRIEKASRKNFVFERAIDEITIPRWRKTSGTLTVDPSGRQATLSLKRKKDKTFQLLTVSPVLTTRGGWSYIEYQAMDEHHHTCRFWLCTHESGSRRLLTLYPFAIPDTIYGYNLVPQKP